MKALNYSNDWLKLLFTNVDFTGVGDAGGLLQSAAPGSLYVSLHTANPGTGGSQLTNETGYTGYGRIAVARSGAGWTVASNQVSNAGSVTFGICTANPETVTHFGVGTDSAGAGQMLYAYPLIQTYFDCTANATSDTITAPGHTLLVNDTIQFIPDPVGTLPGNVTEGTTYYVITVAGNDLTISTTLGGATLNITSDGTALVGKITSLAVNVGVTPEFLAGQLVLREV